MDAGEPWDRSSGPPFSSPGVSGLAPRRGQAPGPPRPGPAKVHLAAARFLSENHFTAANQAGCH